MGLRGSASSDAKVSPYFVIHGFDFPLPIQSDVTVPETFYSREAEQYAIWLKKSIKSLHDMVRINRIESKFQMKKDYDIKHKAKQPDFKIGDLVLLKDTRITHGSNKILTKRPYVDRPYVIKQIVSFHGAEASYKLTDEQTAKDLRGLVTHDRLQIFFRNQAALVQRQTPAKACFKPTIRILRDGFVNDEHQFLVLFEDGMRKWRKKSQINDRLLGEYWQNRQRKHSKMLMRK